MAIGERTSTDESNDKCPICNKPMGWTEGLLNSTGSVDGTVGRYGCIDCRLFEREKESRATTKGRELAHTLKIKNPFDKNLIKYDIATQIGYFREIQHCKTCKNNMGEPCICEGNCDCLYCKIERGE